MMDFPNRVNYVTMMMSQCQNVKMSQYHNVKRCHNSVFTQPGQLDPFTKTQHEQWPQKVDKKADNMEGTTYSIYKLY